MINHSSNDWLRKIVPVAIACAAYVAAPCLNAAEAPQLTFELKDFLTMPLTGAIDGAREAAYLARPNMIVEEPGGTGRLFIVDMNGPVYIFDKKAGKLTKYLDLNGEESHTGIFHKLRPNVFSQGFVALQFDPDYVHNGKFYTTHCENPADPGVVEPDNSHYPGLKLVGYKCNAGHPDGRAYCVGAGRRAGRVDGYQHFGHNV